MTDEPRHVELSIVRLGAQGDGIAETCAGPVYVQRGLPGERVLATVTGERARIGEIAVASAQRVAPPCPHFGACGGCAAQHMGAELYRAWKRDILVSAFAHRGLEPRVSEVVAVAAATRRRATFAVSRMPGGMTLGFHEEGSHALVDITTCHVVVPAIAKALPDLRALCARLIKDGETARATVTATDTGLDVAIEGCRGRPDALALSQFGPLAAAAGVVRLVVGGEIVLQSAVPRLTLGEAQVALPPGAFIQAAAEAETAMRAVVVDAVGKARHVADLFAGLGTFSLALARRARVLAVDGDRAAVAALVTAGKATPGVKPIEARVRDLFREPLSRQELKGLDAVVLDPPRAGAKAQAEVLARAEVPTVCVVSCNPGTLARDCRILVDGGYTIAQVVPVDQFVWSPHLEAVAVLVRSKGGGRR